MNITRDRKSRNGFDRDAIDWARDVVLPNERALKKLNPRACRTGTVKSVLLALSFRVHKTDDGQHVTWAGAKRMARDTGYNERTVRASIDVLGKLGLLKRDESDEHGTDTIYLRVTMPAPLRAHCPHPPPGINTSKTKNSSSSPEDEEPEEVVVPTTTTPGEISDKNPGEIQPVEGKKVAGLWPTKLNPTQLDKLHAVTAELETAGFDPATGIKLVLKRWPRIRKAVLKDKGDGYVLTEHPLPGNVLCHMPYVLKQIVPSDAYGNVLPTDQWSAEIADMLAPEPQQQSTGDW